MRKNVMRQPTGDLSLCHSRESGNPDGIDSPVTPAKAGAGNDRIPPFSDRLRTMSYINTASLFFRSGGLFLTLLLLVANNT